MSRSGLFAMYNLSLIHIQMCIRDSDLIPAVKPQIAMYEQFGIPGIMAFKKTLDYCHEKDLIVIGDIKRGDIGSTSGAYATGHLGKARVGSKSWYGFNEDFITINPYMGTDSVQPVSYTHLRVDIPACLYCSRRPHGPAYPWQYKQAGISTRRPRPPHPQIRPGIQKSKSCRAKAEIM